MDGNEDADDDLDDHASLEDPIELESGRELSDPEPMSDNSEEIGRWETMTVYHWTHGLETMMMVRRKTIKQRNIPRNRRTRRYPRPPRAKRVEQPEGPGRQEPRVYLGQCR